MMPVKEIIVSYARKVSTGPYENADVLVSETVEMAPAQDDEQAIQATYRRVKAAVDRWCEDLRA